MPSYCFLSCGACKPEQTQKDLLFKVDSDLLSCSQQIEEDSLLPRVILNYAYVQKYISKKGRFFFALKDFFCDH